MKVVINAFSARRGGGQTYLLNLLQYLDGFDGMEIYILAPESLRLPEHAQIRRLYVKWPTENPLMRTLWEKYSLSALLGKMKADILFCPGGLVNTIPPKGCKTVTMFRNMLPFDPVQRAKYPPGLMRIRHWLLERAMLKSMINADLVIFISEFARNVIEERTGNILKNVMTIPHGINEHFRMSVDSTLPRPDWLPANEYFLYVSVLDEYKNQIEVVRGFHLLKKRRVTAEKLVLAGDNSSPYAEKVRAEIARLRLQEDVILVGNIPYCDLPNVYHHAKINVFASMCENCPNILLEALGAGRPMIVSIRQPMPEFGGDAVIYFDPSSPDDFADKIVSIIDEASSMMELATRARMRSYQYDWQKTARQTWSAIANLHNMQTVN